MQGLGTLISMFDVWLEVVCVWHDCHKKQVCNKPLKRRKEESHAPDFLFSLKFVFVLHKMHDLDLVFVRCKLTVGCCHGFIAWSVPLLG